MKLTVDTKPLATSTSAKPRKIRLGIVSRGTTRITDQRSRGWSAPRGAAVTAAPRGADHPLLRWSVMRVVPRLTIPRRIFLGFALVLVASGLVSTVSFMQHERTAAALALLDDGYLP